MALTTDRRYGAAAIVLHWTIAALILFNLITGSFMESLGKDGRHIVVSLHSSTGLTILALSLARVALRLTHKAPSLDDSLSRLEQIAAKAVHVAFYVLMIAMPLIGWSITSASTRKGANSLFYLLTPLPKLPFLVNLPDPQKIAAHDRFVLAHTVGAWLMLALLIVHVAGALKHQFLDGSPQFARMWFAGGGASASPGPAAKSNA